MREVKRSALLGQPPARVFGLINDIDSYPKFLPWCTHARVLSRTPGQLIASIGVRQGALQGEFTTRNTLEPERSVRMQLVSGPFRTLDGQWLLTPIEGGGCRVELSMRFAFTSRIAALLFESKFAATIGSLVDAFVARARARP